MPIKLKRPDSSESLYRNAEYIPAYLFLIAHSPGFWVQELTDERILPTVEDLFRSGQAETMAYPSEAVVSDYLAQIIPAAMGKYIGALLFCPN